MTGYITPSDPHSILCACHYCRESKGNIIAVPVVLSDLQPFVPTLAEVVQPEIRLDTYRLQKYYSPLSGLEYRYVKIDQD